MTDAPFSLLLPVYAGDRPDYLAQAFRSSVHEQSLRPDQVVLVRDGPVPPELEERIRALVGTSPVETSLVSIEVNRGLAHALEIGLEHCRHDIVARMDADDVSLPRRFELQLARMAEGFDLVGSGMIEFVDRIDEVVATRTPHSGQDAIAKYSRFHDPFNHPTVVYRATAVREAGGYRPMGLMEDYWLFARMISAGARVANIREPLVAYRVGDGAYARRGGVAQLRAEIRLQREFRRMGFTSRLEYLRNVAIRGGYRLVPENLRRVGYRAMLARQSER